METVVTPDELSTREVISDPYSAYRQLRDQSPFNYLDLPDGRLPGVEGPLRSWALLKYRDSLRGLARSRDVLIGEQSVGGQSFSAAGTDSG